MASKFVHLHVHSHYSLLNALPKIDDIVKRAKTAKTTISSYVLRAVQLKQSLVQEDELLARVKRGRKNYKAGKTKILRSLEDLL